MFSFNEYSTLEGPPIIALGDQLFLKDTDLPESRVLYLPAGDGRMSTVRSMTTAVWTQEPRRRGLLC